MYRRGRYRNVESEEAEEVDSVDTLLGLAKQEARLVPSLTAMAKEEASQATKNLTETPGDNDLHSFQERSVLHERLGFKPSSL